MRQKVEETPLFETKGGGCVFDLLGAASQQWESTVGEEQGGGRFLSPFLRKLSKRKKKKGCVSLTAPPSCPCAKKKTPIPPYISAAFLNQALVHGNDVGANQVGETCVLDKVANRMAARGGAIRFATLTRR